MKDKLNPEPFPAPGAVVAGASAGGGQALAEILGRLPGDYGLPILVAQHLHPDDGGGFAEHLAMQTPLRVVTPCDKQPIEPGTVYVAPANYHLLVERNGTLALSTEDKVGWSRPSIDVLFESAASAWGRKVLAILLTGASSDGTQGLRMVKALGGTTVVQDPATAQHPVMPRSAVDAGVADHVMPLEGIGRLLAALGRVSSEILKGKT
jgi:two-component system, chemotaxis family, protein-glutamate methylesterase/glutaminase